MLNLLSPSTEILPIGYLSIKNIKRIFFKLPLGIQTTISIILVKIFETNAPKILSSLANITKFERANLKWKLRTQTLWGGTF